MIEEIYGIFRANGGRVTTDSRAIEPGDIFFALRGENFDGNRYALAALKAGAAATVVDDPTIQSERDDRIISVHSTLETLQCLARYHRRVLGIPIIALTGSNGKTTTKEFLRLVLSRKFRVGATRGNLNNHIGVPLTLLGFDDTLDLGVVEMGANHCGEIALLCSIAEPDYGIITNIGRAHLEGFGGEHGVCRGKGELFDYLASNNGLAIYNSADAAVRDMVALRPRLRASSFEPERELSLQIYGRYNQFNAWAAIAAGREMGVTREEAIEAVCSYVPDNNRSQVTHTAHNILYLDCYNANPSSMRVALDGFRELDAPDKVVILGDMRELGEYSASEHEAVRDRALEFKRVYLVGEEFSQIMTRFNADTKSLLQTHDDSIDGIKKLLAGSCERADYSMNIEDSKCDETSVVLTFADVEQLAEYLRHNPIRSSHILVKGSRAMALEKLVVLL